MAKGRIKKATTSRAGDGHRFREKRMIRGSKASIFIPKVVGITLYICWLCRQPLFKTDCPFQYWIGIDNQ